MALLPLDDTMKLLVLILLTTVYISALSGLCARALKRIEERLDKH